jgi:phosphoglycerate dehydrogenase-like enzyme
MRLAALARAFDIRVIGVRRTARPEPEVADQVVAQADLARALRKELVDILVDNIELLRGETALRHQVV